MNNNNNNNTSNNNNNNTSNNNNNNNIQKKNIRFSMNKGGRCNCCNVLDWKNKKGNFYSKVANLVTLIDLLSQVGPRQQLYMGL